MRSRQRAREHRDDEIAAARQNEKPGDSIPGPFGAHNWHPMSFNPQTGLAYVPAQHVPLNLMDDKDWKCDQNVPSALGAVETPPFPWQNRGTYHQVVELSTSA